MKNKLLKLFSKIIRMYGIAGAGLPSYRGIYEMKVPDTVKANMKKQVKQRKPMNRMQK